MPFGPQLRQRPQLARLLQLSRIEPDAIRGTALDFDDLDQRRAHQPVTARTAPRGLVGQARQPVQVVTVPHLPVQLGERFFAHPDALAIGATIDIQIPLSLYAYKWRITSGTDQTAFAIDHQIVINRLPAPRR